MAKECKIGGFGALLRHFSDSIEYLEIMEEFWSCEKGSVLGRYHPCSSICCYYKVTTKRKI